MPTFPGVDYILIDSQFSEQELLVRRTAREFVDERVLPLMRDCYRDARFPSELIPEVSRSTTRKVAFMTSPRSESSARSTSSGVVIDPKDALIESERAM